MANLSFPINRVKAIYDHVMDPNHTIKPCLEDLFNDAYYPGGKVIMGNNEWPDASKIDSSKLPRTLWLVKDQGVYLMASTSEKMPSDTGGDGAYVVYAKGMNPNEDEFDDWWYSAKLALGGDDCVISIPADWLESLLKHKPTARTFRLNATSGSISLKY